MAKNTYHEVRDHIRTVAKFAPKTKRGPLAKRLSKLALDGKVTLTKLKYKTKAKLVQSPQGNAAPEQSRENHALECIQHARWLTMLATDASKDDAFEVIKLAVRAMLGQRADLPVDRLTRLREIVLQGTPQQNKERDLRLLVELVGRYAPKVLGRNRYGLNAAKSLPKEMRNTIQTLFGPIAKRVTAEHCAIAFQEMARPRRAVNGVVVDLIIHAGLWGWDANRRGELRIAIARAVRRTAT